MSILTVYTAQLQLIIYRSHRLNLYTALYLPRHTRGAFFSLFDKNRGTRSTHCARALHTSHVRLMLKGLRARCVVVQSLLSRTKKKSTDTSIVQFSI